MRAPSRYHKAAGRCWVKEGWDTGVIFPGALGRFIRQPIFARYRGKPLASQSFARRHARSAVRRCMRCKTRCASRKSKLPQPAEPPVPLAPLPYGDPAAAFAPFAGDPVAALLESAAQDGARGRYSYVAIEPVHVVTAYAQETRLDGETVSGDPFAVLQAALATLPPPEPHWPVPFRTGAVGYLGYELGRHLERLPAPKPDPHGTPDMVMGIYDTLIAFDHEAKRAHLLSTAPAQKVARILARLDGAAGVFSGPPASSAGTWRARQSHDAVEAAVARTIDYICDGDIFQANITHRLEAARPPGLSDLDLYRRLRAQSPAPFAALLSFPGGALISASPERFLSLTTLGGWRRAPSKARGPVTRIRARRSVRPRTARQREGPCRKPDDRRSHAQRSRPRLCAGQRARSGAQRA